MAAAHGHYLPQSVLAPPLLPLGLDTQHSHQRHSNQGCTFNQCNPSFSPFETAKTTRILPLSLPPIVDCASTDEAATTLEAITALLWNCVNSRHCCQPNSSLTAATPILAFLIALDRLTFKEITAGMVER
jgi:hypothetical protein